MIFHEKNLKCRKIVYLTNFYCCRTFFLIASYQILQNYAILINHEWFFQEKESVICLFTDLPVKKYISLLNQLIITDWISGKNVFTVKSVNFH